MRTTSIAHIVNVVGLDGVHPSYLHIAQPITLASMVQARAMAADHVKVDLLALRYPNDTVLKNSLNSLCCNEAVGTFSPS
jgi:hypothetical protein